MPVMRLIRNLTGLADKSGEKLLEITMKSLKLNNREYIRIIFYDTGTGIKKNILDKISSPFFSTKPQGEGTGLGLSISHGIIKNHGGSLRFESVEGKFTKVYIDLPVNPDLS